MFTLFTVALVSAALTLTAAAAQVSSDKFYSNQTPYGDPAATSVAVPPAGYDLFFVENVARHGSRSLTTSGAEKRALAVWTSASRKGALTSRGKKFVSQVRAFQKAEKKIGYGKLSSVGKTEWRGIGRRTADSSRGYFTSAAARGEKIVVQTSPIYRTKQSANYMRTGMESQIPALVTAPRATNRDLLIEDGSSKAGRAAIAKVMRGSSVKASANRVLLRLYKKSYVNRLSNPVAKALDIYLLYTTAAGMAGDTRVTFADYVPVSAAKGLAEAVDARNFYRFGPGVAGERSSFKRSRPVLDDFFSALDARIGGDRTAAVFRHAHGEVTMPFAALIEAPGSEKQAARSRQLEPSPTAAIPGEDSWPGVWPETSNGPPTATQPARCWCRCATTSSPCHSAHRARRRRRADSSTACRSSGAAWADRGRRLVPPGGG